MIDFRPKKIEVSVQVQAPKEFQTCFISEKGKTISALKKIWNHQIRTYECRLHFEVSYPTVGTLGCNYDAMNPAFVNPLSCAGTPGLLP